MKIGLFFGSFNPIHVGHLIIANHIVNFTEWKRIWFVVSPQNPLKKSYALLNERNRLHLLRLAIDDDNRFKACDIEFTMPGPSYTIDTVSYLREKYQQHQFSIIMGSDGLQNLPKWKNYKDLVKQNIFILFERRGFPIIETEANFIKIQDTPLLDISASFIRQLVKQGKSIKYLVPDRVMDEIERGGYYRD